MLSIWRNTLIKRLLLLVICVTFTILPAPAQSSTDAFALRNGDRVVFYGDSITAQRLYTRFTEDFVVSRYPEMHIDFFNAGVSGDTVEGGHGGDMETRVRRDVLPLHPTVVTIMLGMNDGRYTTEYDKNFAAYADGYRHLVAALRASLPDVRLYLIRPSPYDEIAHPPLIAGYNSVMLRYGQFVADLGRELGIAVIDFNQPLTAALQAGMRIDPAMAGSLLPDRIHPSPAAHWIMAAALAEAWHLDPVVSSVTIDAQAAKIAGEERSTVRQVAIANGAVSWTQLDRAVPLPLELNDTMTQFLLKISDLGAVDQEMLRVSGLTAPHYTLLIDGQKVGSFTREDLNSGVNLALIQTPIEQGAKAVDWTSDDRAKLSSTRFDLVTESETIPSRQEANAALDVLDRDMIDSEYKSAQPKAHAFELVAETQ
jgi:lysophospholipase L1-like esterase